MGLACLLVTVFYGNASAADYLRYNPFEEPDMEADLMQANTFGGNELKLRGTVMDGGDSMVNINGDFYRLDQDVSGYRVIRIESGKVTLRRGSHETVLTLNDEE